MCLDFGNSHTLRHNVLSLLADCARHQACLRGLIDANKRLKLVPSP